MDLVVGLVFFVAEDSKRRDKFIFLGSGLSGLRKR